MRRTKSAQTLSRLAQQGDALTHEVLDAEPAGKHLDYLRQLLVFAGVLPARNEAVEGTKKWLTDWLADADHDTAVLLRRYATWSLLRASPSSAPPTQPGQLQELAQARHHGAAVGGVAERARNLPGRGPQGHVDQWLVEGKQTRYELRDFVLWAQREQLCGPLHVPFRQRGQPHQFLTEDRRWAALRRCANDDSIPLATRAAGGLVLLFGFAPGRLVRLTVNDVTITEGEVLLNIGRAPLPLPGPMAAVIREQVEAASTARTQVVLPQPSTPERWLFPSEKPGRHADAGRLVFNLQRHVGIQVRPSHNAALSRWAEDLPVSILADVLGMNSNTAARWCALVQRNWVGYVAERAAGSGRVEALGTRSPTGNNFNR